MERRKNHYMPLDHMDDLYNSDNILVRYVHNKRLYCIKYIFSKLDLKEAMILDAGCGEGHLLNRLNNYERKNKYCGIEKSPLAIKRAKKRVPAADILKGDIHSINFPDNFFDVILCTEVLERVENYGLVLDELDRVLKSKGIIIITFPNEPMWTLARFLLGRRPIREPSHLHSITPHKLKRSSDLKIVLESGLPFSLPFSLSLGYLMVLRNI